MKQKSQRSRSALVVKQTVDWRHTSFDYKHVALKGGAKTSLPLTWNQCEQWFSGSARFFTLSIWRRGIVSTRWTSLRNGSIQIRSVERCCIPHSNNALLVTSRWLDGFLGRHVQSSLSGFTRCLHLWYNFLFSALLLFSSQQNRIKELYWCWLKGQFIISIQKLFVYYSKRVKWDPNLNVLKH